MNETLSPVLEILGFLATAVTVIWAIVTYFAARRDELRWKRTEFLFRQGELLDNDPDMVAVTKILEGRDPAVTVEEIFSPKTRLGRQKVHDHQQRFDKLLSVYERIGYAVFKAKSLTLAEVDFIGWLLVRIVEHPPLVEYCLKSGFPEVVLLAKRLYGLPKNVSEERILKIIE